MINHNAFIQAIHNKTKIRVTFFSKEDNRNLTRLCAPMDYGPFRKATDASKKYYHLWDYESDKKNHNLALSGGKIVSVEILQISFDPSDFITWTCNWFVSRDWGIHS